MKLLSLDHVTINLLAPEKSFAFYEQVLELRKLKEVDMGDHVLHLYGLPGAQLELIAYKNPQKTVQAGNTDVGVYRHFALVTDDLEEIRARCLAAGYGINLQPTYIDLLRATVMLIRDPNGVEIEMIQR
jgi:catechol 2,3-dioxygenase-like lactoylglutathione lyase family enzyme